MDNLNEYKNRFYTLMESTMGNVKQLINEQMTFNDYISAFNQIITPWMTNMGSKLKSQGFTCKNLGGDDNCDDNLYGFKLLDDSGVEKYKYNYYFPYESGLNLKLYKNENDDSDVYFSVYLRNKVLGNFGKGAKTAEEINKAANDSINLFNSSAERSYGSMYPK